MSGGTFLLLLNSSGGTIAGGFTADAVLKGTVSASFTSDSWIIRVTAPVTFTADAVLKGTIAGSFTANAIFKRTMDSATTPYEPIVILGTGEAYFRRTAANTFFIGINADMIPAGLSNEDTIVVVSGVRNSAGGNDPGASLTGTSSLSWSFGPFVRGSGVGSIRVMYARYAAGENLTIPNFGDSGVNETGMLTVLYLRNVDPVMIDATPTGALNSIDPPATTMGGVLQLIFGVGGTDNDGDNYSIGTADWTEVTVNESSTSTVNTAMGSGVWKRTVSTAENYASFATMSHTSGGNLLQTSIPFRPVVYPVTTFTADAYMPLSITEVQFTADAVIEPKVIRLGGTSTNFSSSNSSAAQDTAFTLPATTDYLVVFLDIYESAVSADSVTWKPDSGNAGANQAMTQLGRQAGGRSVEVWGLANPTATVTGSVITTDLSGVSKKIMGVHALRHVGFVTTPVGRTATDTTDTVDVTGVGPRSLVFDSATGTNSTQTYTVDGSQTSRWNTNTTGGLDNLRGYGSEEAGAYPTVTMSWTHGSTQTAHIALGFNPPAWDRTFTADAVIGAAGGEVADDFTADAIILRVESATFTGDAVLKGTLSTSFTGDAVLKATLAASFTGDSVLLANISASFTADAIIARTESTTFTADSVLSSAVSASFTGDAIILRVESGSFTADAILYATVAGSFTADSYIIYVRTGSFTGDAVLLRTESVTFTADSILLKIVPITFTADASILRVEGSTFTADARLLKVVASSFTADSILLRTEADDFTADAYLIFVRTGSFSANAILIATVAGTFTANAYIVDEEIGTFTADSVIKGTLSTTFTGDSVLKGTLSGSFTANAVILRLETQTFTANAILLKTVSVTFSADSRLLKIVSGSATANAVIVRTEEEEFSADSILLLAQEADFTADAEFIELVEVTFTADAYIIYIQPGTFTADARLRVIIDQAFTGDSLLRSAGNIRPPQIGAGLPGIAVRGGGAGTHLGAGETTKVRPTRGYPRVIAK